MLANFRRAIFRPLSIIGLVCLGVLMLFHEPTSFYYYLTVAQLLFVPIVVELLVKLNTWEKLIIASGQLAVTTLFFSLSKLIVFLCVFIYLTSTIVVAWQGVKRFLKRGFVHIEEMMIDLGLIYLVMGGVWFFAFHLKLDFGFSPIITWLTAIHFHYSAFLLCISVGLIGRIQIDRFYRLCCFIIAAGPILVALGITFSRIIELVSVSLYIVAIFCITYFVITWKLPRGQRVLIRGAFLTLCFTIVWSLLYAWSNLTGIRFVDIPDMLAFHGFYNCIGFGCLIVLAWGLSIPPTKQQEYVFPISKIRGKLTATGKSHPGLVDDMSVFINKAMVPTMITDFYEHTSNYHLTATVKWSTWFKPFAFVYQFISRRIGQLNLPYSSKPVVMDGQILKVDEQSDGRVKPRVWQRAIEDQPVFTAIYSTHWKDTKCYMNIALPLPFSTMHGILHVSTKENNLHLTSDTNGDAGTYLVIGDMILQLPLHEYFILKEEQGTLRAKHHMTLFGLSFLHIDYEIQKKMT